MTNKINIKFSAYVLRLTKNHYVRNYVTACKRKFNGYKPGRGIVWFSTLAL